MRWRVGQPASFVTRQFTLPTVQQGPVLHISAQGLYRAFINGERVGDDYLTPGWTYHDDRIAYQSYDITSHLVTGENRIEIWLVDGWYRSQMMWALSPIYNCWGEHTGAIAEIMVGGDAILKTDASWKSGLLPVLKNGIYYGEDLDVRSARAEVHYTLSGNGEETYEPLFSFMGFR